jgi:ribonuclease P protein component
MLPRKKRLTTELFDQIITSGRIFNSPLFTLRAIKIEGKSRFSAVASKKIFKTAVARNRIRRRVYAQLETLSPKIKDGFHGVLLSKQAVSKASSQDLSKEIEDLFVKTGIIQ